MAVVDKYFDSGFENADKYEDLDGLVRSLELQQNIPILLELRNNVYSKIKLNSGDEVLEIGCGLGATVREISALVGSACKVTGIDKSSMLLNEAIRRTDLSKHTVAFTHDDAENLSFRDNQFAFVCAERVLMHVPNPQLALSEMTRVLKKGGIIAVTEPDLGSVRIYPDHNNISSKVINQWCKYTESPRLAKDLLCIFQQLGLENIDLSVRKLIVNNYEEFEQIRSLKKLVVALQGNAQITDIEAETYLQGLMTASKQGNFAFSVNVYHVSGQKQ